MDLQPQRQRSDFWQIALHQSGYTVHAPLLPGHGTTPRELNQNRYQDWLDAVDGAYAFMQHKCTDIFVAGESMGALLSLYLAARQSKIAGVICYSPACGCQEYLVGNSLTIFCRFSS